jgi:hypothetical protein
MAYTSFNINTDICLSVKGRLESQGCMVINVADRKEVENQPQFRG